MAPAPGRRACLGPGTRCDDAEVKSGIHPAQSRGGGGARCRRQPAGLPTVRGITGRRVTPIRGQAGPGAVHHASPPRGVRQCDILRDVSGGTAQSLELCPVVVVIGGGVFVLGFMSIPGREVYPKLESTDRKSTRLNSSHANISYAVFC